MNNHKSSISWHISCIIFLLVTLYSLNAYPFWHLGIYAPMLFAIISAFLLLVVGYQFYDFSHWGIFIVTCLTIIFSSVGNNINGYVGEIIKVLPFLLFVQMSDKYKVVLYKYIRTIFAWLIAISSLFWILHLLGFDLPYVFDFYGYSIRRGEPQYMYHNHFLYIINLRDRELIERFSCVFLEPGYFACLLCIFLFIGKFNFKDTHNKIFLLALFLSFSLAGWIICFAAYVMFRFNKSKHRILNLGLIFGSLLICYSFFSNYNGGDNVIKHSIIDRVELMEETNSMTRTTEDFDQWFDSNILNVENFFLGNKQLYEKKYGNETNVGWKVYFSNNGFIGFFIYLLYLFVVARSNGKTYMAYSLCFIYVLIFARGHHIIYYFAFMFLYNCGTLILGKNKIKI